MKIDAPIELSRVGRRRKPGLVQHAMIRDRRTPRTGQGAKILLNRVFTKEKTNFSLKQSSSPFFPREFRPLILLKTKDRFTSLMVIRVMKIMCNREPPKV
jgi:hypothetical protein